MNAEELTIKVREWGASLLGFADLADLVPQDWDYLKTGVSIGVPLSNAVIDEIRNGPTFTYAQHYRTINQLLDSIAMKTSNFLRALGYHALPVPASQIVDSRELTGRLSHKMVATRSGLGWIGKNALLVTTRYGPRVRLASVMTDAPLTPSTPISTSRCGACMICVKACPAQALKGRTWTLTVTREDLLDATRCHETTRRNQKIFGEQICGICISVCPFGRTNRSESLNSTQAQQPFQGTKDF